MNTNFLFKERKVTWKKKVKQYLHVFGPLRFEEISGEQFVDITSMTSAFQSGGHINIQVPAWKSAGAISHVTFAHERCQQKLELPKL